ncbi:protein kinase family protein [Rivularia sp. PCC 7116]|uniref:serine/threonine-protein kinase n=1 Tax=Rivularia sp. PCC 7116 TaxID=373994 RepID=UPI00029F3ACF|nr:serine/threonine-protein kinase [Rivularia sp. PCC 7116]AFY52912.1 protein kinase family protein [Rivularia sp. PCC 7116]
MNQMLENRYRIVRELGDGGFGKTYVAQDTHMPSNRYSVIKQLKPMNQGSEIYQIVQDRFLREAAILEQLGGGSNQIPTLYAYFESNGQFYLVQEYIEGETLSKKLRTQGKLSSDVVKDILLKILPVLEYVHNKGIVHRDIKPDNIIIRDADNLPVLIDFGAVKETMQTIVSQSGNTPKSSIVIGTPGFMSSEQLSGRPVFNSDLYALGMTAIYLLTGKMPQELDSDPRTGEVVWKEHAPDVSSELAAVLDKAVQSHLRDRFSSANEMLNALKSETIATTIIAPPSPAAATIPPSNQPSTVVSPQETKPSSSTSSSKGSKAAIIVGIVSLLVLGGVGTFAFSMMNQQQAVQQRLASIEAERQKAEESRREQNENNSRREQELQRQLEEEKKLREEAEKRRRDRVVQVQSNSNSTSNTSSNTSSNSTPNSSSFPEGTFANSEWSLNLFSRNNNIYYQAQSLKDSSSLSLQNGRTSGSSNRRIYTWNNGAYRYQVTWQPNDPDYVRLRVFTPSGEQLNQLLSRN